MEATSHSGDREGSEQRKRVRSNGERRRLGDHTTTAVQRRDVALTCDHCTLQAAFDCVAQSLSMRALLDRTTHTITCTDV